MSFSHMMILAIIALIVIPPDKLPEVARQLARFINDLKRSTAGIWDDLKEEALLKPEDLLKVKNPKSPSAPPSTASTAAEPLATEPHYLSEEDRHVEKKPNE